MASHHTIVVLGLLLLCSGTATFASEGLGPRAKVALISPETEDSTVQPHAAIAHRGHRRRHGNVCSSHGAIRCHATVLLAAEQDGPPPEGEAALNLAYILDESDIGPAVQPGHRQLRADKKKPLFYTPAQLQHVYLGGRAPLKCEPVGIVGAFAYPKAVQDLAVYRKQYGLGEANITMYDQDGLPLQTRNSKGPGYVKYNSGWAEEQMLDLSMVSAICPCCPIIYVGSKSTGAEMYTSITTAVRKGAKVVSMSWGIASEAGVTVKLDAGLFNATPGIAFTASSGDNGFAGGVNYPASSPYVIAVGGTSLYLDAQDNRVNETAWSGAGSGCSKKFPKPKWQTDKGCTKRTLSDISAVSDPETGVSVYIGNKWSIYGGTSAAAPIIGAMYGGGYLGSAGLSTPAQDLYPGGHDHEHLYDVTVGRTGRCTVPYYCKAEYGYDGPTGNGSPNLKNVTVNAPPHPPSPPRHPPHPPPRPPPPSPPHSPPRPPAPPAPPPAKCGKKFGSCPGGACCGKDGHCGLSNVSCGAGCQSDYGYCTLRVHFQTQTTLNVSMCYQIPRNNQTAGVALRQANCSGGASQTFFLNPAGKNWYFIKAPKGLCIGVAGKGKPGDSLALQACKGSALQTFGFTTTTSSDYSLASDYSDYSSSDKYYLMKPKNHEELCASVAGDSPAYDAAIELDTCNDRQAQKLVIYN